LHGKLSLLSGDPAEGKANKLQDAKWFPVIGTEYI
jgi:hypothetical protein